MSNQGFFGEYNNIYFLTEGGTIRQLCDRAHRKRPVYFSEGDLEDLADEPRKPSDLSFRHTMADGFPDDKTRLPSKDDTRAIEIAGRHFRVTRQAHTQAPAGFGLGLKYQVVAPQDDRTAVLLTLKLPDKVRYSLHWNPITSEGTSFTLPEKMAVTIFTHLSWRFENGSFVVETESEEGEVTFLVESFFEPIRLQQTVILTVKGRERDALIVRAACCGGFVPCFVLDNTLQDVNKEELTALLRDVPCRLILSIGLPSAQALETSQRQVVELDGEANLSEKVAQLLAQQPASQKIIAPDLQDAYGPALLLAIRHNASLRFQKELPNQIHLEDSDGCCLQEWLLSDLLGVALDSPTVREEAAPTQKNYKEIVVCESTIADLMVCQGIGYSDLVGCPIAFLPQIDESNTIHEFPDGATGIHVLETKTDQAVPHTLRTPDADIITIFTRHLPLHLTPIPNIQPDISRLHWVDRFTLAHLPGQIASQLVPRLLKEQLSEAPAVPFAVIFDALGQVVDTEGNVYADELASGLSHPIVLPKRVAQREILREILQRLEIDLLLLITHGSANHIEDGLGDIISNSEISNWEILGSPIVFNNSCTSWATTGQAFLSSGARAFIGTLWPIANEIAAKIAAKIGKRLNTGEEKDLSRLLVDAVRGVTSTYPNGKETAVAYIYVGLPGTHLLTRPAISNEETVALLAKTFQVLYKILNEIAIEGRPDLAVAIQQSVSESLRKRFMSLLVPGELPLHLPYIQQFSILDIDFLLASNNFKFGKSILNRLPHEYQLSIIKQMDEYLHQAIYELVTWDDRHDKHLGRTEEWRKSISEQMMEIPVEVLGERGFIQFAAKMVLDDILPFVTILVNLQKEELARWWFNMAAKLVTTPDDLQPDGVVTDEALIRRIREGIREKLRSFYSESDDSDNEVWLDHLEMAVNKSDLANRFGAACLHLKDYERATAFFGAACDLAEPGSVFFANATSNLASTLKQVNRYEESIIEYQKALIEQEQLQDYRNAVITVANMFRSAARARRKIDEVIMQKALAWADALPVSADRIKCRCDLLGASACYYASLDKHEKAAAACENISHYLQEPFPTPDVAVHLNESVDLYYEKKKYSEAATQACINAASLEASNLLNVATRTYGFAGECALQAYGVSHRKTFLSLFLECSQEVGGALRSSPNLFKELELGGWTETTWENTLSLWQQLADKNERVLALQAYKSVKAWEPHRKDNIWELLANAYHLRNMEAVQSLAVNGALQRRANLSIGMDMQIAVDRTTARRDLVIGAERATLAPDIVYGYQPLYDSTSRSLLHEGNVEFVAGGAVYTLRDGESITIREEDVQVLKTDGQGTFLYQEVWGSRLIPYELSIDLAQGLIPLELELDTLFGSTPRGNIRFDRSGCRITIKSGDDDEKVQNQTWLAEVRLIFRKVPGMESIFCDPSRPFVKEVPFNLYSVFLHLLRSEE